MTLTVHAMSLELRNHWKRKHTPIHFFTAIKGFPAEEDMYKEMRNKCLTAWQCKIIGGIVFNNLPPKGNALPSNIRYTIRVIGGGEVQRTTALFSKLKMRTPRKFEIYGAYITAIVC